MHALRVDFADGSRQTIDFAPVLAGELGCALQDPELFGQVRLDPEVHTLVWPNGADFDRATLHDWPLVADELAARAPEWACASPSRRGQLSFARSPVITKSRNARHTRRGSDAERGRASRIPHAVSAVPTPASMT